MWARPQGQWNETQARPPERSAGKHRFVGRTATQDPQSASSWRRADERRPADVDLSIARRMAERIGAACQRDRDDRHNVDEADAVTSGASDHRAGAPPECACNARVQRLQAAERCRAAGTSKRSDRHDRAARASPCRRGGRSIPGGAPGELATRSVGDAEQGRGMDAGGSPRADAYRNSLMRACASEAGRLS